ncbi:MULTISPECIES: hypothetical protein [unclassified Mesorhizobium]|uniref:hypothetical protein n=1 Tax=unclassified Mesorhizobium TaxID=325217 RepID=UPI000F761A70|nr:MULTISPECIES: hypothetical protein [unclassified Mesorhizobium]TGT57121.1 hypothetical protein EN813_040170 [Mesorhizobium sp. M00.F.Ca.ET.170.01.1.1]AZO10697.1 hypothetical protein EJ074_17315 [Mesorhizobium sp. M3A.F.Ca.ET.080.04.2.1]RWB70556.1 MAG: hypothetical protein EOQ49_17200 [Mesorhizobium sp.]RWB92545.1 MAG: hypothetical protein EOQ52_03325 [Mesorhizobium sp.]RWE24275.1 MAG: hypothetical protein EOS41_17075 [Mesorhizobium sp.]
MAYVCRGVHDRFAPYLGHQSHPDRPPKAVTAGVNAKESLRREDLSHNDVSIGFFQPLPPIKCFVDSIALC